MVTSEARPPAREFKAELLLESAFIKPSSGSLASLTMIGVLIVYDCRPAE
jgi:hypothetical protein